MVQTNGDVKNSVTSRNEKGTTDFESQKNNVVQSLVRQNTVLICSAQSQRFDLLDEALIGQGMKVRHADNERDAFASLRAGDVQLVLIDQQFEGKDGISFVNVMQRGSGKVSIPVFALLEEEDPENVARAYRHGVADFLLKSQHTDVMLHRIRHQIHIHRKNSELAAQQHYLSKYDPLTGLYNRRFFNEKLTRSMQKTAELNKVSALLHIDVDNFKRINSSFNYQYGDGLLQQVANRLSNSLRGADLIMRDPSEGLPEQGIARLGGDEFILYVEDVGSVDNAVSVASRCLQAISEPLSLQNQNVVLTASIGLAVYPMDGQKVDALMKNAEKAMYSAKELGGNCHACYKQEMNLADESSFILENDLRDALNTEQLSLHYQPQVDGTTGKVTGVEVLCRWSHPFLGMVPPDRFIPIAESSGLIVPIGDWVLETACKQVKAWLDEGVSLSHVAVNVSAHQFHSHDFIDKTRKVLADTGLPPSCLELELTESLIMSDAEENIAKLLELKSLGIMLAVDDFGTGYSSLAYLKRLPIDTLKIDRSFVCNISEGSADGAIVSAILALAEKLNLNVVAEGVEECEQLTFLRNNCCTLLQGYYFSPAKPADEVMPLIINSFQDACQACEDCSTDPDQNGEHAA